MNTVAAVLEDIEANGSASIKKVLLNHGAREPFYGTKIEHLKKIQKKIKNNQALALELYNTGVSDAMYLAGLVADGSKMSRAELQHWAETAYWYMLSEFTVPWVAAEHADGWAIGMEWIVSEKENVAAAGWATLGNIISIKPDEQLDKELIIKLLDDIAKQIHNAPNRVRYVMNTFVICVGGYMPGLTEYALETAKNYGKIHVDLGSTACKVPEPVGYIAKMLERGGGKKTKLKC